MTVASDVQDVTYDTDGSTTGFPIPFYFLADSHIVADLVSSDGVLTPLVLGTDFTLSGAGSADGGELTTTVVETAGLKLHIYRSVPVTQETQYQQNDAFPAKTTEKALDKLTMIDQQHAASIGRALQVPMSDIAPNTILPKAIDRANKALGFDNLGNPYALDLTIGFVLAPVVSTMAQARLVAALTTDIFVLGYYAACDGAGGTFHKIHDIAPAGWENGGTRFVSALGAGFELAFTGPLSIKMFGAPCNGVDSDYPYIVKHFAWLSSFGGGTALVPDGAVVTLTANQVLAIPESCFLRGERIPEIKENDVLTALTQGTRVVLGPGATLQPASSAGVERLIVITSGIRFDVASSERTAFFQGTAISIPDDTSGQIVRDCVVLGFYLAVGSLDTALNIKRVRVQNLTHDCANGVYLRNSRDLSEVDLVWGRPFCSFNATPEANDTHLKRDGSNVYFDGVSAYSNATNCFAYGWQNTYRATGDGDGAVTFSNCGADGPGGIADGSIGFDVADATYEIIISTPRVSGKDHGIYSNTKDQNGKVTVVGGQIFECFSNCVVNAMGELFLTGVLMRNAGSQGTPVGNGVYALNSSTKTHISNCSINGMNIGVKTDSNGVKVFIDDLTSIDRCTTRINNPYLPGVESANALPIDGDSLFYHVVGNADIYSILYPERYAGKILTLKFDAALTVRHSGGNIVMAADYVSSPNSLLRLSSDGVNFYA